MASGNVHYVYKETRLNLEPQSASSIVQVQVSSANGLNPSRPSSHRTSGISLSAEEKAYRIKNLATASSIYTRKSRASPRSFLWRVLDNDTVLSIRVADVCKKQKESDATLILHIRFSSPLRTSCIGFADSAEHDALTVFAIDYANNLHAITLRPDVFRKRSVTDGGLGDAVKTHSPPGFGFKHPHRLVAVTPDQFIVTMHDGGILRFDKNKSQDGRHIEQNDGNGRILTDRVLAINGNLWKETIYNVSGWGQSLRGLVPFPLGQRQTVKYDKINMELTAATSAAVTSMGHNDTAFLFTICLDHRMRVWDVRTGQILYTGDIVDSNRDPQDNDGKWTIEPSQHNLIRIVETAQGQCLVVTYSPVGSGEFKFWKVKANNQGSILVADCFPKHTLHPPPTGQNETWTMADFGVALHEEGPELWALWKNNLSYRVRALQVHLKSSKAPFSAPWTGVFLDNISPVAQRATKCDPTDETERWLDLIFSPGRFARSTLETALAMYEKGSGTAKDSSSKGSKTLAESICAVIGSAVSLDHNSKGDTDHEQFRKDSGLQWKRFYRLLVELDKQRGEALALVVDSELGMPWVLCADLAGAVRQCSNLDLVSHNMSAPEKNSEEVARLIKTGLDFVGHFREDIEQLCRAALRSEMFEDSDMTDEERLQFFYDKAAFYLTVPDDVANEVVYSLGQNFRTVTPALYEDLFDLLKADSDENSRELQYAFTPLGQSLVVRATQDTSELHWQILFSQLILLVHMEFEIDDEEATLHARFDIGAVYRKMLTTLRRLEHIKWMTKTEMTAPVPASSRQSLSLPGTASPALSRRSKDEPHTVTALEGILGHLLGVTETDNQPLMSSITDVVTNLCAHDSDIELLPHLHQCFLLKADRPDLALQLSPFADQDCFSTYVQGRVFLALQDYDTAAEYFKKAAIGLSKLHPDHLVTMPILIIGLGISMKHIGKHSCGLLDDMEWKLLNSGLPKYYSHIVNLFDKQKAYSFVIDFARLALQFTDKNDPESAAIDAEILSRLFTAATTISHFDMAHSALLSMKDEAMQKSYLCRLVEKMCETGQNRELVALPFAGLQDKVDEILLEKCKTVKDVLHSPVPYHQVLYAWRVSRNDYRGGAAVLHDRLQKLRHMGEGDKLGAEDVMDTQVTRQYLLLINALSCIEPKQAFILEDLPEDERIGQMKLGDVVDMESLKAVVGNRDDAFLDNIDRAMAKNSRRPQETPRKAITLADLRKQYQEELDRIVAIQTDQFEFTGDEADEMDIS
jgi:nuclear pore complex protein Nup160